MIFSRYILPFYFFLIAFCCFIYLFTFWHVSIPYLLISGTQTFHYHSFNYLGSDYYLSQKDYHGFAALNYPCKLQDLVIEARIQANKMI